MQNIWFIGRKHIEEGKCHSLIVSSQQCDDSGTGVFSVGIRTHPDAVLDAFSLVDGRRFFLVITIFTFKTMFKNKNWKPLFIQVLTVIFMIFFPFTKVTLEMDFKRNHDDRMSVVNKINEGAITPNVPYNDSIIHLPGEYQGVSKGGGDILIEKKEKGMKVLFFTFRGIVDSFSGFVYSSSGERPRTGDFGGDFNKVEKLDEHWYFVSSG
ncbi:hypothetical protein [Rossellomorea sp. FM04394]|uniref:hypothetical protein n=1 Tax=Rossellomorea sp. FM04394 TaxID=3243076 RepID=UPI0035A5BFDF